jgi:deoxycytidylate deaminase
MCAKRLINLGNVKRVLYAHDYRTRDSVDLFAQVGITVAQVKLSKNFAAEAVK